MCTIKTANTEESFANTAGQDLNWLQIILGIIVLLPGSLVYIIARTPEHTYFLYQSGINLTLNSSLPDLFGMIGNNLPSFAHALAFILITAGLFATHKHVYVLICLLWFIFDSLFELGQWLIHSSTAIPNWFAGIPFLENTENYFINGTFDWNDVASIAIAAIAAYIVLRATTKMREVHHEHAKTK